MVKTPKTLCFGCFFSTNQLRSRHFLGKVTKLNIKFQILDIYTNRLLIYNKDRKQLVEGDFMIGFIIRLIEKVLFCILIFCLLTFGVYAESFYVDIRVDNNSVIYSGISGSLPTKTVNALVISGRGEPEENNIIGIQSVITGEDGIFDGKIYLDYDIAPGKYKIFVDSENGGTEKEFIIIDDTAAVPYLNTLNSSKSAAEFENCLSTNSEYFGIFYDDYADGFSYTSKLMFALKPKAGYDSAKDVLSRFHICYAICNVVNSTDVANELKKNADILSVDFSEYSELSDASKATLNELIKKEDYTKGEFKELFEKNLIYADIKSSDRWSVFRDRMLKYATKTGINLKAKYNQLNDKDAVFQEMFKSQIDNFDSLVKEFNSIVDQRYSAENKADSSGFGKGSGGGGSGAGGKSVFVEAYTVESTSTSRFYDISGHWAAGYIEKIASDGSLSGYPDGSFKPDRFVTRAEFTTILVNVFKLNGTVDDAYSDVSPDDWYYKYIMKATANSLIYGSDGKFRPEENITRQDAALIVHRLLKQKGITMENGTDYIDAADISDYAVEAVSELSGIGVVHGNEGRFLPQNYITRAETATIIAFATDKI